MTDEWRHEAACRGAPTDLFYPDRVTANERQAIVTYCTGCPVKRECLAEGLALPQMMRMGIWGGRFVATVRKRPRPVDPIAS